MIVMARKTTKNNLYKAGVDTLVAHMTLKKPSLEENLKHLRDVLSVDTIIDDINQEEALEFLDAIDEGVAQQKTEADDLLQEVILDHEKEIREKDGELTELKDEMEDLQKESDLTESIKTVDVIEYRTSNLMDEIVMQALKNAYEVLTPVQIIDRLKLPALKDV